MIIHLIATNRTIKYYAIELICQKLPHRVCYNIMLLMGTEHCAVVYLETMENVCIYIPR